MSRSSRMRDSDYGREERRSRMSSEMSSMASRVYIGNLNFKNITRNDIYDWMNKYGKVQEVVTFERHALVQFERESDARRAIDREKGQSYRGNRGDIRFASTSDGSMDSRSEVPRARSPRTLPYERDSRDMSPYRETGRDRSPSDRDRYYKAIRGGDSNKIIDESETVNNNRHGSPESYRKYERSRGSVEESRPRSQIRSDYPVVPKEIQEPKWNSPPFTDKIGTDRPGFDAAIIVMSSELLNYAETIESRLQRQIALTTHIIVLKEESHANACVEDLNHKSVLYAFLVNSINEQHFSCTLRILYGTPQEHRNMPLNNALTFVARNFESYQKRVRDLKTIAPKPNFDPSRMPPGFIAPDDKIIYYLHLLADSRMLTIEELNELIEFVQKRIQALASAEETMEKDPIAGMPVESVPVQNSAAPKLSMSGIQPVRDEKVIQHQTQLHSQILNILKPVPHQSATAVENIEVNNMEQFNTYKESASISTSKSNNMVMNPKVQQALDTLMQSQFRPSVPDPNVSMEEASRNFQQNNQSTNPYSMNPNPSNMRPMNPHANQPRPMSVQGPSGGQPYGNNFHGYYQQPPLGQPLFRGRPPFQPRPQYPGY